MYDILGNVIAPVVVSLTVGVLYYVASTVRKWSKVQEKHNRILFGEDELSEWNGIVPIVIENKRVNIENRRAMLMLVNVLISEGVIKTSKNVEEIVCILSKEV